MTFQSVPDCAEAVISFNSDGKIVNNVLGFFKTGGFSQLDINNLATMVDTAVLASYVPHVSVGVLYEQTLVRGLTNINDFSAAISGGGTVGGISGNALPANVTLCVTLRSPLTGRSARGRFYAVPTGVSQQFTQNTFAAAYITGIETFLDAIQSGATSLAMEFSVISRFTLGARRTVGTHFPITTIASRNNEIDSQRGRLTQGH